jgi:hypothetical protein
MSRCGALAQVIQGAKARTSGFSFPFHHHAVFNLVPRFDASALHVQYFESSVKKQHVLLRTLPLELETDL